jgi:Xaa-Pro aminopeptidase
VRRSLLPPAPACLPACLQVRIEDNVLVGEGGCFNITMEASGLAKDPREVEAAMRG